MERCGPSLCDMSAHHPGPDEAGFLSRSHIAWATRYVWHAWWTPLQPEDLPATPSRVSGLHSDPSLFAFAERSWAAELTGGRKGGPDLIRGVWLPVARHEFRLAMLWGAASGLLVTLGRPLMMRSVLLALDPANGYTLGEGMGLSIGLCAVLWIESWTRVQSQQNLAAVGACRMLGSTMHLVSLKAAKLATTVRSDAKSESALIGNDLVRPAQMVPILTAMVSGATSPL